MKKYLYLLVFVLLATKSLKSQAPTTAMDFTMNDCNGNVHNLFTELDSGSVVIMEFFMLSCSPCITAGNALDPMYAKLKSTCSNKINFYHFGFTNSYTCSQITNWVTTHSYTSVPIDSGGLQVAYYDGMGMPTIAVVAGSTHKVLYVCNANTASFVVGDTSIIADSIRAFFHCNNNTIGIKNTAVGTASVSLLPNPAAGKLTISLSAKSQGAMRLDLVNMNGQRLAELVNEQLSTGSWNKTVDIPPVPPGFYFIRGEMNGESFVRKIAIQQD